MARGSSSRHSSTRHSSSRRNPHGGFHRIAINHAGGRRERHRVPIDANEVYRLYRWYESASRDVKLPDRWHLNPNRVPIPPLPTGRERSLVITERKRLAMPEQLADPRYAGEGPTWDAVFQGEYEAARHSFFAPKPPEWFLRDSVSPGDSDDTANSDEGYYQRLPEEMPPPGWLKKGPDSGSGGGGSSSLAPVIID